jgi:Phage Terminase
MVEIDRALADDRMLGAGLSSVGTWQTWLIALKAAFALPLTEAEREEFRAIAGERGLPKHRVRELWCVAGRRSGKSRMAAAVAIFLALFQKHRLSPGERGMCLVIAGSVDQARTVFNYVRGFLEAAPALAREVVALRRQEIELRNGIVIAVHSNSYRTVRGRTLVAAIFDETAFWRDESTATPDTEVYTAVLPSLATTDGMLIGISTPYRKFGLLYQKHRDHFGVDDDDVLVVQGGSTVFNPTLSDATIAAQRAADPTAAGAEWDAQFRSDIGAFLDDDLIDAAVEHGRPLELPPVGGVVYRAFVDASGGAVGGDAYTIAIGHREGDVCVIDAVRGTSGKFDPQEVTKEYAELCTAYHVHTIVGDNYAREWVAGAWRGVGKEYTRSPQPKGAIYLECLPMFTRGLARLPDHARLVRELRMLERRTHRSGKDTVEHPRNGHDDYANVVCGVLNLLRPASVPEFKPTLPFVAGRPRDIPGGSVFAGAGSYQGPSNEPWRDYVNPDGSIRSTPRSRWDF